MKGTIPTGGLLLLLLLLSPDPRATLLMPPSTACCTQLYRGPLPNELLKKVLHIALQEADRDCYLQAFVLHLAHRSICVHPQNRSLARWLEHQGRKR
ncbi:C-C motif chemokine 27 [Echinops telfairi]|uniref:C-C motif chemokine 27 n=1 Tax=Echinops telfairi TaxID=9371 RepID=A0ABM0J122_ECHTE|nr:C-C motif chemokine 27 [Echinops telfairi]